MRQIDRDVDAAYVAERERARLVYQQQTAKWGAPERCRTGICDGDGSCVACDAIQGETCRAALTAIGGQDG